MVNRCNFSKFFILALAPALMLFYHEPALFGSSVGCVLHNPLFDSEADLHNSSKDAYLNSQTNMLLELIYKGDIPGSLIRADKIAKYIKDNAISDSAVLCNSYYLLGISYLVASNYENALHYFGMARAYKETMHEVDERYARILYNSGVAYYRHEDWQNAKKYSLEALQVENKLYGKDSPLSLQTYSNIIYACTALKEYDLVREMSNTAIMIAEKNNAKADKIPLFSIYVNRGVSLLQLADYSKAKVYFENAEQICLNNSLPVDENTLVLFSNLAITYGFLGMDEKSNQYYEKGIVLAEKLNASPVYVYIKNYAIALAKQGKQAKGEQLLKKALERAKKESGEESLAYIRTLSYYADYTRDILHDYRKACSYFSICINQLNKTGSSHIIRDPILFSYSLALNECDETSKALEIIQNLLWSDSQDLHKPNTGDFFINPGPDKLSADKLTLLLLQAKYSILWKSYRKSSDTNTLLGAASTAKLLIGVLEKVRMSISEEDSRLILGDRFRDAYINAINIFSFLYDQTGKKEYLESAFEFTEKSKVSGLLASARELNASHFNIPADLADLETRLRQEISSLNAGIEEKLRTSHPDTVLIGRMKDKMLAFSIRRDSLISVFENKYPGYYSFKYSTSVPGLSALTSIIGSDVNYLNYIASDTSLLIFVANRKEAHLIRVTTDSTFMADIRHFRGLLGMPSPTANAREDFVDYLQTGYRLYQKIVEPVKPYFISEKLLISPDNILSYIPFETLPVSCDDLAGFSYARLPYLMNEYDISYTYSVTFMAESMKRKSRISNNLVAFAPDYDRPINLNSVMLNRQTIDGLLPDLPFAKQEAEYVSQVTGGKLFENSQAKKSVFNASSEKYDIIHLAMHTILNDRDPMYSTLIFGGRDTTDDRYLRAYEVYSIPLRAKMVVLSSCNSGAGYLYSGEGILSLARGFLYSGSASVVMAMWEIEDRSGTEIVKSFYDNLKKGCSKSTALRKARINYLHNSDQLRSHPYFWSSLVVYGNNRPLYYSPFMKISGIIAIAAAISAMVFYFWRRRYS